MKNIIIITLLIVIVVGYYQLTSASNKNNTTTSNIVTNTETASKFTYNNRLSCVVTKSLSNSDVKNIYTITTTADSDEVVFQSSGSNNRENPMVKFFENQDTLTVGWIATGSGSGDMITIDKDTGLFGRVTVGNLGNVYTVAEQGYCY